MERYFKDLTILRFGVITSERHVELAFFEIFIPFFEFIRGLPFK